MTDAITVENVSFAYDKQPVLKDISLTVAEGDFLGLIGPNGSGKTTLLKLMLGLKTPDSGRIELFGTRADKFKEGTRLAYVSQQSSETAISMPVTVREVVRMGRYAHAGLFPLTKADRDIVSHALETVGIDHLANRKISRLSGGQQQRAYIARALASEADLLALDEPTVGVDADSVEAFYELLGELNSEGMTIILIEHDIGVVAQHANMMACLDCELYEHCETQAFLESGALERVFNSTHGLEAGQLGGSE